MARGRASAGVRFMIRGRARFRVRVRVRASVKDRFRLGDG